MSFVEPVNPVGRVAELFAGVGGFRLGLAKSGWKTIYSNQWEPTTRAQHASDVYVANFGQAGHTNVDIATVETIPSVDLLVGGFPCQDYSVAKSLNSSKGLEGKKGVLWWEILRFAKQNKPKFLFLENVDRLLKSPASQRGRDFAIMLASLGALGYTVEWRVVNAADYGFPQRRRRVFIVAYFSDVKVEGSWCFESGILSEAFPATPTAEFHRFDISSDLLFLSEKFGLDRKFSPFRSAGLYQNGGCVTVDVNPVGEYPIATLGDVLLPLSEVPKSLLIDESSLAKWKYLKGAKSESRVHASGFTWKYSEGSMVFPDPLDRPSRTLLTGEGGSSPSRFKHVVEQDGVLRRLHPIEMERLNGFPDNWTQYGRDEISDVRRAFFMGNALVVGLVERVGYVLAKRMKNT